jgi:predicted sulfurtransferase
MKQPLVKVIPCLILSAFLFTGCAQDGGQSTKAAQPAAKAEVKKDKNVYKGQVVGKSNKAKTISISVGKGKDAKTVMVKFDDKTKGVEHASKGHAAIIAYEVRGKDKYATVIKPKLAKLPEGVTEIKTPELQKMVADKADMVLVDARPAGRYAAGHLPGAISLSVPKMKETKAALLPKDKNKLLIFYCGGPT